MTSKLANFRSIACFLWLALACTPVTAAESAPEPSTPTPASEISLGLEQAVRQALEQNVALAIERIAPRITATTVEEAKEDFDTTSSAEVDYSETSSPRSSEQQAADGRASTETRRFGAEVGVDKKLSTGTEIGLTGRTTNTQSTFNQFDDEYDTFAGLTLRHPLLKNSGSNAQLFRIRSARKRTDADWKSYRDEVENLILRVHSTYYELLFALADYKSKAKAVATAERLMVDNQNRYELGTMTPLDVSQAKSEVSQRISALLLAELQIQQRQYDLKRLIFREFGDQLSRPLTLTDSLPTPERLPPAGYNLNDGLRSRQDLQALIILAERSGLEINYRRNQIFPQLDVSGSIGFRGRAEEFGETVDNIAAGRDEAWGVGLSITFPWGLRGDRARLERSELENQRLFLQIKDKEQEIIQEIINAHQEAENARLRHSNDRAARVISEKTAEAEEEKLKEGISTSYTVLQLQRDATDARTRELRSLVNYYQALIELRRAQGLLLNDHGLIWSADASPRPAASP